MFLPYTSGQHRSRHMYAVRTYFLVKAKDLIWNRHYSRKLQFLHVNASNLCKIAVTLALGGNISLPNKIPLVLPFEGPLMIKQVANSFFLYSALHLKYQGCYYSDCSKNPE